MSRSSEDLPFKLAGGNAVGLFITDAKQCDGILPGDQIMQVSNENTTALAYLLLSLLSMFYCLLLSSTDQWTEYS